MGMKLSRRVGLPALILATGATACAVTGTSAAQRPQVQPNGPQQTVTASLIKRHAGTLAPGTKLRHPHLGTRVFVDARHGFALAGAGQAQYAAATSNRGRTWVTDGPALHIDAAQAPLAVAHLGAASRKVIYAYGEGNVVDVTSDGGKHWYGALFDATAMAVVPGVRGHLVAFVDGSTGAADSGPTWQYVSKDGGRSWHYDTTTGGS
jgi:hypothetical protein